MALGTDSGGSIRIPAACCGVVGLQADLRLVSARRAAGRSRRATTTAGPLALDVAGCETMLGALVPDFEPAVLESLEELEVGVAWTELADPLVRERVEAAAALFPRRRPIELPLPDGAMLATSSARLPTSIASSSRRTRISTATTSGVKVERCLAVRDAEVEHAGRLRAEYRERAEEAIDGLDLVLTPTLPFVAPPLHRGAGPGDLDVRQALIRFTFPFGARLAGARAALRPGGGRAAGVASSSPDEPETTRSSWPRRACWSR